MKFLKPFSLLILVLLAIIFGRNYADAATRITAVVTITNAPVTNHMTFVLNGVTRTWTNSVTASPSTLIATNAAIGGVASNLFTHLGTYKPSGPIRLYRTGTNDVRIEGAVDQAVTVTFSGAYASVAYSTQTVTIQTNVLVPANGYPTASAATNVFSSLITALDYSTNSIDQNRTVAAKLVGLTNSQTFGNKTITNSTQSGGVATNISLYATNGTSVGVTLTNSILYATNGLLNGLTLTNATITNATTISGTIGRLSNGTLRATVLSATYATNGFASYGTGENAEAYGSGALATNTGSLAFGRNALAYGNSSAAIGTDAVAHPGVTNALAIGGGAEVGFDATGGSQGIAVGVAASVNSDSGIAIGYGSQVAGGHTNSIAFGTSVTTTDKNQIRLGSSSISVSVAQNANIGNNIYVGDDWDTAFVASMAKGILFANGTAASANPTNGILIQAIGGEAQYRASAADEGAGQMNRVHNRGESVVCSGANYSFTTSYAQLDFGGTDPVLNLPTEGTWLIIAEVRLTSGGTANDTFNFKLRDDGLPADISNTDKELTYLGTTQTGELCWSTIYTALAGADIAIYGKNNTAARGTAISTGTRLKAVRLF